MRRLIILSVGALALAAMPRLAGAQALGPQRQFLAIEPYYQRASLDGGQGPGRIGFNGYGARLWINTDPFHFIANGSVALFLTSTPKQDVTYNGITSSSGTTQLDYGLEYDQFFVRRPMGGVLDPFVTVGYARHRIKSSASGQKTSYNALPIGGGIRVPLPNRFELRGDVKDLLLFSTPTGTNGANRTTNNLLLQAGLGLTF